MEPLLITPKELKGIVTMAEAIDAVLGALVLKKVEQQGSGRVLKL